jgi:hypothetical protein
MEQHLDATYLKHDLVDRAAATALVAARLGVGVFLAAWGVSMLWRYTPPEIAVRVENPEISIAQARPSIRLSIWRGQPEGRNLHLPDPSGT